MNTLVASTGGSVRPACGQAWRTRLVEQVALDHLAPETPPVTLSSFIGVRYARSALVAFVVGTGGLCTPSYVTTRDEMGYRLREFSYPVARSAGASKSLEPRSAAENLARVREVFKPSVTELASLFGVSRQTIYNWQSGQPIAIQNEDRLEQLARAADLFQAEGFAERSSVLRRRLPGGKTLFEAVRDGEGAEAAATRLVDLVKAELNQRTKLSERLAARARRPIDSAEIGAPHVDSGMGDA